MLELDNALEKCNGSSPGIDNINYEMIKNIPFWAKSKLLKFYNEIFCSHDPHSWREALVIPLPKPGKSISEISAYRPISLTCCLSKILQRIVNNRLTWQLETVNRFSYAQNGFRKYRSTADNHAILETDINEAFANKKHLIAIFLVLKKAYDSTWT